MLFRRVIGCSGGLYAVLEGYRLFMRFLCCYVGLGLYAVLEGYKLFWRIIYCLGGF